MALPDSIMLLVKCMTYNQKAFIEDAMNGFCMQKTSFPFICIIMDDCSTDGEQDTIKNYFQEHFTQLNEKGTDNYIFHLGKHKTNEKCYFAVFFLKYNHYSIKKSKDFYYTEWLDKCKYIAMCEGDDYWTDENKLQIQVDFLEKHPEYSCSGHGFIVKNRKKNEETDYTIYDNNNERFTFTINDFCKKWVLKTLTCIYKKEVFEKYIEKKYQYGKDLNLQYHALEMGNGIYFPKPMGVYNIHDSGVWSAISKDEQAKRNYLTIKELFYKNKKDIIIKPIYINILSNYLNYEHDNSLKSRLIKEKNRLLNNESVIKRLLMMLTHPRYIAGWLKRIILNQK